MKITLYALCVGYIFDLLFGDPQWILHPVRFIGWMIEKGEKLFRKYFCKTQTNQYLSGMALSIMVIIISFIVPWSILYYLREIHWVIAFIAEAIMCYQILATKALKTESMKVYDELIKENLEGARIKLSYIVGRDTKNLSKEQVARGAIETVAENTSDGVVAPLIFMLIGGAPLGFLYKSINTLDSMIGYKNDTYLYFGRFAAKLDDIVNFIPARIAAYLMIMASFFSGLNTKEALRIYQRDKNNHTSPNSAHTEAVCAGALGIQLGGDNYYFGKLVSKPTIGDDIRPVVPENVVLANRLLYWTSFFCIVIGGSIKLLSILMWN